MCTVLLPPGDNPIAFNKYILSHSHRVLSLTVRNIFTRVTVIFLSELAKQNPQWNKLVRKTGYTSLILLFLSLFCTSYPLLHEIYDGLHPIFMTKNFNEYVSETRIIFACRM